MSDSSRPTSPVCDVKLCKKPSPMFLPAKETHASLESYYLPQCMSLSTKVWFHIEAEIASTNEGRNRLCLSEKGLSFKKWRGFPFRKGLLSPVYQCTESQSTPRTASCLALEKFILVLPGLCAMCRLTDNYLTFQPSIYQNTPVQPIYISHFACVCRWWLSVRSGYG